jgi:hypothetical protein
VQQTGQVSPDGYWMWNGVQWVPNPNRPFMAPPAAPPYEPAASRAGMASILIYSNIAGIVAITSANLLADLIPNPDDTLALVFGLIGIVAVLLFYGTLIGAIVFYCMWLHRVIRNMPSLGSPDPRWSPARSVAYCFIPIVSLVHPLWSVLDAWRGADASRRWLDLSARRSIGAPGFVASWWAAWLIGNYGANLASRFTGPAGAVLDVSSGMALLVAAVLCVMLIRDVTARQERKYELIASGQLL